VQRDWRHDRSAELEPELGAKDVLIAEQATCIAEILLADLRFRRALLRMAL
jgi:hypothetical protein